MKNQLKTLLVVALLPLCLMARGQTIIKDATTKGIWSKAGSPYYVCNDLHIPAGDTLLVEPGVKVYFSGYYGLYVEGKIKATGHKDDSVSFEYRPLETESDSKEDSIMQIVTGWKGIKLQPSGSDTMEFSYCLITGANAVAGIIDDGIGGALAIMDKGYLILDRCLISGNHALTGAGLYCSNAAVKVSRCIFENNIALSNGGAIYVSDCIPVFYANYFVNNQSGEFGGAVFCKRAPGRFVNNVISRNNARFGGAMALMNSNIKVSNNTIADNTALVNGGGIHCTESDPELINTIIWGNKSDNKTDQLYLYRKSAPYINYSDIDGGTSGIVKFTNLEQFDPKIDKIMQDEPGFMKTVSMFYGLKEFSSCIDQGFTPDTITDASLDFMGNLRLINGFVDIGAYEYKSAENTDDKEDNKKKLSADEIEGNDITIFPNPNEGIFLIMMDNLKEKELLIKITNVNGVIVYESNVKVNNNSIIIPIEISQLPDNYVLNIIDTNGQILYTDIIIVVR